MALTQNATLRPATREDVPVLLAMMRATAAEQNVPDAVTATEADMRNAMGFNQTHSDSPEKQVSGAHNGKALVVEASEGEIAGMAFYFTTYVAWAAKSGICLEDLYVLPKYRCRGYARLLVQGVAKKAEELGCSRMEWLCYKENDRALRFYRSLGAKEMEALKFLRLDGKAMTRFANESANMDCIK
ncbi:GNAT family N-acetyltransferase [Aspergillus affinis]|uniref:GNAT family N-acetyltransferase n=1 Tax=Aspergillus affinis TaxID=1070780 RepID=UPI0022FDDB0B|nr:uncharacterized protein KD926_010169 [Aspergillus affinis]KAI9038836.1 hypothetical protein KD926_010169 [Aspergillus affinis]